MFYIKHKHIWSFSLPAMFELINCLKLFSGFATLLIISYANFLPLWNIFAIFCWMPVVIHICVIFFGNYSYSLMSSWHFSYCCPEIWMLYECSLSVGLCGNGLVSATRGKNVVIPLPSFLPLPLHFACLHRTDGALCRFSLLVLWLVMASSHSLSW